MKSSIKSLLCSLFLRNFLEENVDYNPISSLDMDYQKMTSIII